MALQHQFRPKLIVKIYSEIKILHYTAIKWIVIQLQNLKDQKTRCPIPNTGNREIFDPLLALLKLKSLCLKLLFLQIYLKNL